MRVCELCSSPARMYCESDQASLCWKCDTKVHCANFLVSRHSRTLLCHVCQTLTPWKASGEKVGPTVFVCQRCVDHQNYDVRQEINGGGGGGEDDEDRETRSSDDDEDDISDEDDDDDDDQVVPWSSTPPPPVSSSSSSEESSSDSSSRRCIDGGKSTVADEIATAFSLKRRRDNTDLCSDQEDQYCCSSYQANSTTTGRITSFVDDESTSLGSFRSLNDQTIRPSDQSDFRSTTLIGSHKRFQQDMLLSGCIEDTSTKTLSSICKLNKDTRSVDLVSAESY